MKANKKLISCVSVLSALFLLIVLLVNFAKPIFAYAESIEMEEPKVAGLVDSVKAPYKDMFYVGAYEDKSTNYTLNYRYYTPADMSEKVPLIIFLHGRGERGSDNNKQLDNAILRPFIEDENSKFYGSMVIAPQCPAKEYNNGWVELFTSEDDWSNLPYASVNYDFDTVAESNECKAIVSLIEDTCQNRNIDRNRIYIIGLSQGAIATWYLLAKHPDLFAAAVPIAGSGDVSKAEIYANIPIYAFHGMLDTTVNYEKATPQLYEAINAVGKGKMNFVAFTNGQHAVWESAIVFKGSGDLPGLEEWLFSQKKTESKKKGCSGSIDARSVFIVIPVAAAGAVLTLKKKEN